jgi:hypothetical protein
MIGVDMKIRCRGGFAIVFWIVCFRDKVVLSSMGEESLAKASRS